MGQAKLKGTRDERVAAAVAIQRKAQEARDAAEMDELVARSKKWALMSQAERDAALERAKREASNYGQLQEMFGHDVAGALAGIM